MSLFDTIKKAVGKVTSGELGSDIYDMTHSQNISPPPANVPLPPAPAPKSIYDMMQPSVTGKERTFGEVASGAPAIESATIEAPGPINLSSIVNNAVGKLALVGENLPSQGGPENIAKAVGGVLQTPRNVIEGIRSGVDSGFQAHDSYIKGESPSKILSKGLKTVIDPALSIISATPVPMMVQAGLQFTGLADEAQGGVNFLKNGVSDTLTQKFGVDKDVAEELGGTLIDGAQTLMSIWGGSKSGKAGSAEKVQSLRNAARQKEIIDTLTTKAAARPGATKASIKAEVKAAIPQIRQATSRQLTVGELAQHNLKMLGYDVAANTALPVLGIAMQSVKDGDYNNVEEALASFASNAGITLSTAIPGFKGIKRSNKKQMQIGDTDTIFEKGYGENPEGALPILEARKQELIDSGKGLDKDGITYARTKEGNELFHINSAIEQAKLDIGAKSPTSETLIPSETPVAPVKSVEGDGAKSAKPISQIIQEPVTTRLIEFIPEGYKKKTTAKPITRGNTTLAIRELPGGSVEIYDPSTGRLLDAYSQKGPQWDLRVDDAFARMEGQQQGNITSKKDIDTSIYPLSIEGMEFGISKNEKGYVLYDKNGKVIQDAPTKTKLIDGTKQIIKKNGIEGTQKIINRLGVNFTEARNYWDTLSDNSKKEFLKDQGFRDLDIGLTEVSGNPNYYRSTIIDAFLSKDTKPPTPETLPVAPIKAKSHKKENPLSTLLDEAIPDGKTTEIENPQAGVLIEKIQEQQQNSQAKRAEDIANMKMDISERNSEIAGYKKDLKKETNPERKKAIKSIIQILEGQNKSDNEFIAKFDTQKKSKPLSTTLAEGPTPGADLITKQKTPTLAEIMGVPKTDPIVEAGLLTTKEAKAAPSPTTKKTGTIEYTENPELSKAIDVANASGGNSKNLAPKLSFLGINLFGARSEVNAQWGIRGFLNEIRLGAERLMAGDYLDQSGRNTEGSIRDAAFQQMKLADDITAMSSMTPLKALDAADLVGVDTPNGYKLDANGARILVETHNKMNSQYSKDTSFSGFSRQKLADARIVGNIYNLLKNNRDKLSKYFTPEQIAQLDAMNFDGKKSSLYGPMTKKAMTDKAMSEHHPIFDDYDRYVISPERAKDSGLFTREFTVEMEDGSTRVFKNIVDAQQYNQAAIHTGAVKIKPESLSSLTKTAAGPQLDPYRIHDPVTQMIDYIYEMGSLYGNKKRAEILDELIHSSDKSVASYSRKLLAPRYKEMLGDIIGIKYNTPLKKYIVHPMAQLGVVSKMIGNVSNIIGSTIGNTVKTVIGTALTAPRLGKNILGVPLKALSVVPNMLFDAVRSIPGIKNLNTIKDAQDWVNIKLGLPPKFFEIMERNGFISEYDLMDNQRGLVSLFSNAQVENAQSMILSLVNMAGELKSNGHKLDSSHPMDIIKAWETWRKSGDEKFWAANNSVLGTKQVLSSISTFDRLGTPFGIGEIMSPLKKWGVSQARDTWKNFSNILDYVISRGSTTTGKQAYDASVRLTMILGTYGVLYSVFKNQFMEEGYTEDESDKLAKASAKKMTPHPAEQFIDIFKNMPSSVGMSTIVGHIDIAGDLLNAAMEKSGNRKDAYLADAMAEAYRQWEVLKTYDEFTKGKLQDQVLGGDIASMQGATRSGVAKLHTDETPIKDNMKKYFGIDIDSTMENEAYKYLDNISADTTLPEWMKTSLLIMKDVYNTWDQDLLNVLPSGKIGGVNFGAIKKTNDQEDSIMEKKIRSQYTLDALNQLYDPTNTSFKDVFKKQGFPDETATFLEKEATRILFDQRDQRNPTGRNVSLSQANEKIEQNMGVHYDYFTMGKGKTMQEQMENMRIENPYLFNYTVGLIGNMLYKSQIPSGSELTPETKMKTVHGAKVPVEVILKGGYAGNTSADDRVIADHFGDPAITTAYGNTIEQVLRPDTKKGNAEIIKDLETMEKLNKFIIDHTKSLHPFLDSISLKNIDFNSALQNISIRVGDMTDKFPITMEMLKRGLRLRGEMNGVDIGRKPLTLTGGTATIVPRTPTALGTGRKSTGGYTAPKSLTEITGLIPLPDKKKKSEELKLSGTKYQKAKIETSPRRLTISELMRSRKKQ